MKFAELRYCPATRHCGQFHEPLGVSLLELGVVERSRKIALARLVAVPHLFDDAKELHRSSRDGIA